MIKASILNGSREAEGPPRFVIEEIIDPTEAARSRAQLQQARRNSEWLEAHWPDLLPQARGKFLAVAGEEAFLADTAKDAWAMAESAHPEDRGVMVQYVQTEQGPRIYANRRALVER